MFGVIHIRYSIYVRAYYISVYHKEGTYSVSGFKNQTTQALAWAFINFNMRPTNPTNPGINNFPSKQD